MAAVILWARVPSAGQVLWAEDASVFLPGGIHHGCFGVTTPYAGYMLAAPRLIACMAAALDAGRAATIFGFAAVGVGSGLCVIVFRSARDLLPSAPVRLGLSLVLVLTPLIGNDVAGVTTNLHWLLFASAFWVLLWRDGRFGTAIGAAVAALAVTSSALTLLLMPLALLRLAVLRSWQDRAIPITFLVGAAVQVAVIVGTEREVPVVEPGPGQLVVSYLSRVATVGIAGPTWAGRALSLSEPLTLATAGIVLLMVTVVAWRAPTLRGLVLASVLAGLTFHAITSYRAWHPLLGYGAASTNLVFANRYFVAPGFLLWVTIAAAAQACLARTDRRPAAGCMLIIALCAIFAVGATTNFRLEEQVRRTVPAWQSEWDAGRRSCAAGADEVRLRAAPVGWDVVYPCRDLR